MIRSLPNILKLLISQKLTNISEIQDRFKKSERKGRESYKQREIEIKIKGNESREWEKVVNFECFKEIG